MILRSIILLIAVLVVIAVTYNVVHLVKSPEDIRIQQAIIAGGFLAIGWIAGFVLRDLSELIQRTQKRADIESALAAEIWDYIGQLLREDPEAHARRMWPLIKGKNPIKPGYFHPFVTLVSEPVIFQALVQDVYYMPRETVSKVTRFYSSLSTVCALAEDQRSDAFLELPADRRQQLYWDYMQTRAGAARLGWEALRELQPGLGNTPSIADISPNNPDVVRGTQKKT